MDEVLETEYYMRGQSRHLFWAVLPVLGLYAIEQVLDIMFLLPSFSIYLNIIAPVIINGSWIALLLLYSVNCYVIKFKSVFRLLASAQLLQFAYHVINDNGSMPLIYIKSFLLIVFYFIWMVAMISILRNEMTGRILRISAAFFAAYCLLVILYNSANIALVPLGKIALTLPVSIRETGLNLLRSVLSICIFYNRANVFDSLAIGPYKIIYMLITIFFFASISFSKQSYTMELKRGARIGIFAAALLVSCLFVTLMGAWPYATEAYNVYLAPEPQREFNQYKYYLLGEFPFKEDESKAEAALEKAADLGSEEAQFIFARDCLKNKKPEPDAGKAFGFLKSLAEKNYTDSYVFLGQCYSDGYGVSKDYKEAFMTYQQAYDKKIPGASLLLGWCYYYGYGVDKNYDKAFTMLKQAYDQKIPGASLLLGLCYYDGHGVEKDYDMAYTALKQAYDQKIPCASLPLGMCYYYGNGVPKDYSLAVKCFRDSAEEGDPTAMSYLGNCYYSGNGVSIDFATAYSYFSKAAALGNVSGMDNTGFCYYYGYGVQQNYTDALAWFQKAAAQGSAYSAFYIGQCYEFGHGVTQDKHAAYDWYSKAAQLGDENAKERLKTWGSAK